MKKEPVRCADGWDNIIVGMKVEVENSDAAPIPGVFHTAYWVATVLRISGYKAKYLLFPEWFSSS